MPTAAPALAPPVHDDLTDATLGRLEDAWNVGRDCRLLAGADVVGAAGGWSSAEEAVREVARLTAGLDVPGAAIFEVGGRFIARVLESEWRDPRSGLLRREPCRELEGRRLGHDVSLLVRRASPQGMLLRAIVDGDVAWQAPRRAS